jgi:hypothetical protein
MHAVAAAPMMRAQLLPRDIDDRIAHRSAEGGFMTSTGAKTVDVESLPSRK